MKKDIYTIVPIGTPPSKFLVTNGKDLSSVLTVSSCSGSTLPSSGLSRESIFYFLRIDPRVKPEDDNLFLLADAKSTQKHLLSLNIDIPRPICLKTLFQITRQSLPTYLESSANSLEEATRLATLLKIDLERVLEEVERTGQKKVARLESLVTRAFAHMEHRGFPIDTLHWKSLIKQAKGEADLAKAELMRNLDLSSFSRNLFGETMFNIDSNDDLKQALKSTKNESILPTLERYRENIKLVRTYGESFLEHVNKNTNRIHADFTSLGSSTGRSSCRNPNLQNLPSRQDFHSCITAGPQRRIVTADYAACELRILAQFSRDEAFIEAFSKNADVHSEVASKIFGKPVSKSENPHLRQRAKAITFGLIYGMGTSALATTLNVMDSDAKGLFDQFFAAYPRIAKYLNDSVDRASNHGYAETVIRRRLNFAENQDVSRIAKNMPIQGTGADIIKLAMIKVHERLVGDFPNAFLINMIHDELVVECEESETENIMRMVKSEMESAEATLLPSVAPLADVKAGRYWKSDIL